MIFVRVDDLKPGMRLGKPIYNKSGVLLHERNSRLTMQSIYGVKNFGLFGLYILEPAEPLPPMTDDDIQFERFQTVSVFSIRDDLKLMAEGKEPKTLEWLVNVIIKNYGGLDRKINFVQNLRSSDDFIYKHSLNVAILCAMISNNIGVSPSVQNAIVKAAVIHDVGQLKFPNGFNNLAELNADEKLLVRKNTNDVVQALDIDPNVKRLVLKLHENIIGEDEGSVSVLDDEALDILYVAHTYDRLTAMTSYSEPTSEIMAIRELMDHDRKYNPKVVNALIKSINIMNTGVCVELTNKKKGLVITENKESIMRPVILCFDDNEIYDLSNDNVYSEVRVLDVMKTMDNRIKMDIDLAKSKLLEL